MESFSKTLGRPIAFRLPIHFPRSSSISPKPHLPKHSSRKTLSPLLSSRRPPPPPPPASPSLLKPALVSLAAAAAVIISRHSITSLAVAVQPPPSAQSETLPSPDESSDVVSLRALIEVKVKQQKLPRPLPPWTASFSSSPAIPNCIS
ncbi:hypothetical protein KSP39_PZI004377 [Platanthera zijinensis]|uniref:Uncharacterized protein n=1 Tax=Platanthera zijinensis TaxID=2320716 RepID=A0AAP0BVP4_9ASPA